MRTRWIPLCVTAMLLMAASAWAQAQEITLAVVNMELVMKAYPETQSSRLILEQQLTEFEAEQEEMLEDLRELGEEFREARDQAQNTALSEEARAKHRVIAETKLRELRERENEIKETAGLRRKQLKDQETRMRRRIIKKLRDIVQSYSEEKGITLVMDAALPGASGAEAVVYSAPHLDITEDILARIKQDDDTEE